MILYFIYKNGKKGVEPNFELDATVSKPKNDIEKNSNLEEEIDPEIASK